MSRRSPRWLRNDAAGPLHAAAHNALGALHAGARQPLGIGKLSQIPNLSFWLGADLDLTLISSHVSNWKDQIGNVNVTQGTSAWRPSTTTTPTGKAAVLPDADADFLRAFTPDLRGSTAWTMMFALKKLSGTIPNEVVYSATNVNLTGFGLQVTSTTTFRNYIGDSSSGSFTFSDTSNWHIFENVYDGSQSTNATKFKVYIDGVQQTLSFSGTVPTSYPNTSGDEGVVYGYEGSSNAPQHLPMASWAIWTRALTDIERARARRFLGQRYCSSSYSS